MRIASCQGKTGLGNAWGGVTIMTTTGQHRVGIDLGGTKIEIIVLDPDGRQVLRNRMPGTP